MSEIKHPNDMTREELRDLVFTMGLAALDIAQHLDFTTTMLKPKYREAAYKKATQMAYDLAFDWGQKQNGNPNNQILYFGENGLERK